MNKVITIFITILVASAVFVSLFWCASIVVNGVGKLIEHDNAQNIIIYMHFCPNRFSKADCIALYNTDYTLKEIKWQK